MINMAPWQRVCYGMGEVVIFGGLLWNLYRSFVQHACPTTVYNGMTLFVIGLAMVVVPLYPFKSALYLIRGLRGTVWGLLWWLAALGGLAYSLFVRLSLPVSPDHWWLAALVPAMLYFMLALETKRHGEIPPVAPPVPTKEGRDG